LPAILRDAAPEAEARLAEHSELVCRLARLTEIKSGGSAAGAVQVVVEGATVMLSLAGHVDIDKERARLTKEIDRIAGEAGKIERKLANADFVAKAPQEVVEDQRERLAEAGATHAKLSSALQRLASLR
jgi:valyl-tRNA synthetase